jgi:hypothetical protein
MDVKKKIKKKKFRKIHQVLAHPLSEIPKKFLRNSSVPEKYSIWLEEKMRNKKL